jgi:hypothetical protein
MVDWICLIITYNISVISDILDVADEITIVIGISHVIINNNSIIVDIDLITDFIDDLIIIIIVIVVVIIIISIFLEILEKIWQFIHSLFNRQFFYKKIMIYL